MSSAAEARRARIAARAKSDVGEECPVCTPLGISGCGGEHGSPPVAPVTLSELAALEAQAFEDESRRARERDEHLASQQAAEAVRGLFDVPPSPLDRELSAIAISPRAEWALRLLCAWTVGKPAEADEVMQGLAVMTVDSVILLAEGPKK